MTARSAERTIGTGSSAQATRGFRKDIQGLRAVAVALVVLDHAAIWPFTGGYVGVDVFFVISGFLISGHLLTSLRDKGRVDLLAFYSARIRRILPAAVTVIAATAAAAVVLVSPLRLADILTQAVATALYVPNVYFAVEQTDYLAGSAPSPYQHFWSLGVEEQFYLFWPVLLAGLFVVARRSMRVVTIGIAAVTALSFVACLVIAESAQPWAFFSLHTRAWELTLGALVAVASSHLHRVPDLVSRSLTWIGSALVIGSAVILSGASDYPGLATAVPVVGAAMVIGFGGHGGWGASRVLSTGPFQFIGAISYSLYLVHWPLLVLAQERISPGIPLDGAIPAVLAVVSIPIAWILYRFVESPVRDRKVLAGLSPRRAIIAGVSGSAALAVVLAAGGAASALMPLQSARAADPTVVAESPAGTRFVPSGVEPTLAAAVDDTGEIYTDGCQQDLGGAEVITCAFGDTGSPTVVALFGDSHAGRWFPALDATADRMGFRLETFTKSGCRSQDTAAAWDDSDNPSCSEWRGRVVEELNADPPDVIVMTNHIGPRPDADRSKEEADWEDGVIRAIERMPPASRVVTIADTPEFARSPVLCLAANVDSADRCAVQRDEAFNDAVTAAQLDAARATGSAFIDMEDYFCNDETCPAVIGSTLVYADEHHLTATWSRLLGAALERELAPLIRP